MARPKKIQTLAVETETSEMSELIQHGQKIHQVYRDVDLLGVGAGGAQPLPVVTAYIDQYLAEGWTLLKVVETGIRDVGGDRRTPMPILGLLYILVK